MEGGGRGMNRRRAREQPRPRAPGETTPQRPGNPGRPRAPGDESPVSNIEAP